jgi:hypothetical protein
MYSLYANTTGTGNVGLGYSSGFNSGVAALNYCIYLGYGAGDYGASYSSEDVYLGRSGATRTAQTSGVALYYDSTTGRMGPNTSSIRYKTDVKPFAEEKNAPQSDVIYQFEPVYYSPKLAEGSTNPQDIRRFIGYIAEEVDALLSGTGVVPHNANDEPEGIQYEKLVVLVIEELKKLNAKLTNVIVKNNLIV